MKQSCLLDGNGEPKMIRNFAVAIGLYRVTADGRIEVAVFQYRRLAPKLEHFSTWRLFCGTQEIDRAKPETLFEALNREVNGEGASIATTDLAFANLKLLYGCVVPDDSDRERLLHAKVAFAAEYAGGTLRSTEMTDRGIGGNGQPSEEQLSAVEWCEIEELMKRMRTGEKAKNIEPSPRFHQIALAHLLHKVAETSHDGVSLRYAHLLQRTQLVGSDPLEFRHIKTYMTALDQAAVAA